MQMQFYDSSHLVKCHRKHMGHVPLLRILLSLDQRGHLFGPKTRFGQN